MIQIRKPFPWSYQKGYTTIYPFIFYSDEPPWGNSLDHEMIHAEQQKRWLLIPYFLIYVLLFPIVFNPLRYRWEWECYYKANGYDAETIKRKLGSSFYGWMPYWLNGWAVKKEWR